MTIPLGRALGLASLTALSAGTFAAPPLSGAIFTTTVDGSIVNENVHYEAKEDVYLDGGPGPHAPSTAAGLPAGDYYFQVTDPSGKDLLSTDHIACRMVRVNAAGVIDHVYQGYTFQKQQGSWTSVPCVHKQGVDIDHAELGAITVQLYPYDDTPNPGGVYKVWVTPVDDYVGPDIYCSAKGYCNVNGEGWSPNNVHGFVPAASKTDNYKVRERGKPFFPPELTILKFHDMDVDGYWDDVEPEVTGWKVDVVDPTGVTNTKYTRVEMLVDAGLYKSVEDTPAGTLQTVSYLDGTIDSIYSTAKPLVDVYVLGESGETHEVVYGNVGLGSIKACKIFDRNANGYADEDEPGIAGWKMELTGTDVRGDAVGPIAQYTGDDGCTTFADLLPGSYMVKELIPAGGSWSATGDVLVHKTIESMLDGAIISGSARSATFTNICEAPPVDFGTKGYWHNRNGLEELTYADIVYVNSLAPYKSPSSYFDAGDEPFDGTFTDGSPIPASNGAIGEIAPAGSWQAEVSHFLVDMNATGDPREQLAQQLLAFIFNVRHRLDGPDAAIKLPDGSWVVASALIAQAIDAWTSGDAATQTAIKDVLDGLNNNDYVVSIPASPCKVVYE